MNMKTGSIGTIGIFIVTAIITGIATGAGATDNIKYHLAKIYFEKKSDITLIFSESGIDECGSKINFEEGFIEIAASNDELQSISDLGYDYDIIIDDLETYNAQRFAGLTMGGFRTYSEISAKLDSLEESYPSILKVDSIGASHENNTIWAIKISDNVNIEEDEPEVLFTGITHAREPIGGAICLDFAEWLCLNYGEDPDATNIVNFRQVWIIPVVNPDGYLYNQTTNPNGGGMWRKNRRNNGGSYGVDINRNYTYNWGYDNSGSSPYPSSETYRGPSAGSEPENQAVIQFCENHNFQLALHYHGGSEKILHAWGYDRFFTPDHHIYRTIGDSLSEFTNYPVGMTWQQLYPSNGNAYDYSYGEITTKNRIYGYVTEAGPFWPNQSAIPGLVNNHRNYNIAISNLADNLWRAVCPGRPEIVQMDTSYSADFTINWSMAAGDTVPQKYELQEVSGGSIITDGAENGSSNWMLDGFSITTSHHSGSYGFFSGNSNSYHGIMTSVTPFKVTEPINLTFYTSYNIETNYDFGFVQISTDGVNFVTLERFTGSSGGWVQKSYSLDSLAGEIVYIRFQYDTDLNTTNTGMNVDDIYPVQIYSGATVIDDNIMSPSYELTGVSSGAHIYRVKAQNVSGWGCNGGIEDVFVQSFQPDCNYVIGDINSSGSFNGLDVTFGVGYFKGGPSPTYQCECTPGNFWYVGGDVNASCTYNGTDITYMVAYLKGGPALQACGDCLPVE